MKAKILSFTIERAALAVAPRVPTQTPNLKQPVETAADSPELSSMLDEVARTETLRLAEEAEAQRHLIAAAAAAAKRPLAGLD